MERQYQWGVSYGGVSVDYVEFVSVGGDVLVRGEVVVE